MYLGLNMQVFTARVKSWDFLMGYNNREQPDVVPADTDLVLVFTLFLS